MRSDGDLRAIEADDGLDEAVRILRQLWSDEDAETVRSWAREDDYHLLGLAVDGAVVAVAGVSIQRVMHHTRHAWIHDLVVDEPRRGEGHGEALLAAIEAWARDRECEVVALASRQGNDDASQFYESVGYERWGYLYETELE